MFRKDEQGQITNSCSYDGSLSLSYNRLSFVSKSFYVAPECNSELLRGSVGLTFSEVRF